LPQTLLGELTALPDWLAGYEWHGRGKKGENGKGRDGKGKEDRGERDDKVPPLLVKVTPMAFPPLTF